MKLLLTITATVVALATLAPLAPADPPSHPHDYYATLHQQPTSTVPADVRDHAEIKRLVALYGNPWAPAVTTAARGFDWGDAGVGAGVTAGSLFVLGAVAVLAIRKRASIAV
jgi:hypothetical protein